MKCKSCNANLIYKNGIYICDNCGRQQAVSVYFESTTVFLYYIENDEQGRRTGDSLIAQDIYRKLENININAFYQRISGADLAGEMFDTVNRIAFDNAEIVIIIGTSIEHFQQLMDNRMAQFDGKTIIPVYSKMNANNLPSELKQLQAVNYDTAGATVNLEKSILRTLGREQELDFVASSKKHTSRKKKAVIILSSILFALIVAFLSYIVFATPYVLKSKKYMYAETALQQKDYLKAINLFIDLRDYKDSNSKVTNIYNQYEGYYKSEDGINQLHFDIIDNTMVQIELIQRTENSKIVRFSESAPIENNQVTMQFVDSQNNQGTAVIILENQGLHVQLHIDKKVQDPVISEGEMIFLLSSKSDKPLNALDAETLVFWLKNGVSINDLTLQGFEFEEFITHIRVTNDYAYTTIKDTNITLYWPLYYNPNDGTGIEMIENHLDKALTSITAPARILSPEKIGAPFPPYMQDDIFYMPEGNGPRGYYYYSTTDTIQPDTMISIIYKDTFTDSEWTEIINNIKPDNQREVPR